MSLGSAHCSAVGMDVYSRRHALRVCCCDTLHVTSAAWPRLAISQAVLLTERLLKQNTQGMLTIVNMS